MAGRPSGWGPNSGLPQTRVFVSLVCGWPLSYERAGPGDTVVRFLGLGPAVGQVVGAESRVWVSHAVSAHTHGYGSWRREEAGETCG